MIGILWMIFTGTTMQKKLTTLVLTKNFYMTVLYLEEEKIWLPVCGFFEFGCLLQS